MKGIFYCLVCSLLIFNICDISAQKGVEDGSIYGHNEDSIRCVTNYSLYREYARQSDYNSALPYWRSVFNECPLRSKNLYVDGYKIFRYFIENEKDNSISLLLVDSLMMIYDQRIKYYPGDKGDQLERKAVDLLKYRRNDIVFVKKAYEYLLESVNLQKMSMSEAGVATFLTSSITLYQNNQIEAGVLVSNYLKCIEILRFKINKSPDDSALKGLKESMDANFGSVGISCDTLIPELNKVFEKDNYNIENLKVITEALKKNGCVKSELFYKAAKIYHDSLPSAESAANIATLAFEKGDYEVSSKYFKEATQIEINSETNASYYYGLANALFKINRKSEARENALKAASLKENWGDPYILIGQMYIESSGQCSDLSLPKSIYWVAVDKFIKAKSVDPLLEESANKFILTYSKYFPSKEDAFFLNIFEGATYSVGCWINESTKVRF